MAVSQTAEYALRAVIELARNPDQALTTHQIADATLVPQSYLPKVLQPLTREGIVTAQRGARGGYTLQNDPSKITVLEVVSCVDSPERIHCCPLEAKGHGTSLCAMHRLLDEALATTHQQFAEVYISQLLEEPGVARSEGNCSHSSNGQRTK